MKKFAAMLLAFALLASFTTALGDMPDLFFCFSCEAYYRFYSTGKYEDHDTQHWPVYKCSKCKNLELAVESFAANHTGGTATCTEKAVCTVCNAEYGEPLGHDWVVHSISSELTCTTDEIIMYRCVRCDDYSERFGMQALGHDWIEIETVPATCLTSGYTPQKCSRCDETQEINPVDALGHTPGAAATCTTAQVCTRQGCGEELAAALGHTPGAAATCENPQICKVCKEILDTVDHTLGAAATCTEKAVCSVCNSEYGEPLDHDWVAHIITSELTCITNEIIVYRCVRCDSFEDRLSMLALGHDWIEIETVSATCLTSGYTTQKCTRCDETQEIDPIDALGHMRSAAATCTTAQICTREGCGEELAAALGHTPGAEATCTTAQVCTRTGCGEVLSAALGHTPGAEATCTTAQVCTRTGCGEVLSAALGHTPGAAATCMTAQICTREGCDEELVAALGHMPGAAATCTTAQICTREGCGEKLEAALGHTHGAAATCTTAQICTRQGCGEELAAALGHTPGAAATCTTAQICTREGCGEELEAALGHTPGAAATCTTAQICDVCETVLLPATGHDYAGKVIKPTCTEKGYTVYTCKTCSDSYTENNKNARGHWYGLWTSDEGDTHSADCRRCGYTKTVDCTPAFEVKSTDESAIVNACLVCGKMNELQLIALEAPTIETLDKNAIPRGELIVRGLQNPFEGALYALTAAYEYAGKIEPLNGRVSITVPLDLEEGIAFKVVRVDTASDTEEARMEVPFTYEDGKLTFETDADGLFLLLPVE